jgi:hypothetical protein
VCLSLQHEEHCRLGQVSWISANYRDQYMNKNNAGTVGIIVFLLAVAGAGYWYYDNHNDDRLLARVREHNEVLQRDIDRLQAQAQQPGNAAVTPAATETKPPDQSTPVPVNHPDESTWQYREKTDSFTNRKIQWAVLKSLNTLELPFPYQGQQHAYLRIQPMGIHDGSVRYDISLMLERGQFICVPQPYTPACSTVRFKYDNHLFDQWGARRSSDGKTSILELGSYEDINVNGPGCIPVQLEWYKTLAIQAEFFQAGWRTMEFNIEGLNNLPLQQPTQRQTKECRGYKIEARAR